MNRLCLPAAVLLTSLVVPALVAVTGLPATADSQWDSGVPLLLGFAESGFLITVAPPTFTGCSEGFVAAWWQGFPHLDLWSGVWVLDADAPLWDWRWVFTPLGTANAMWENDAWIRVFPLAKGDLDSFYEEPCAFYGSHSYVAEGLGRMSCHSVDDSLRGPGVNSWGWAIQGSLTNNGYCPAGQDPRLLWVHKWVVFSQTNLWAAKSTAAKGPTLTCK